MGTPVQDRSGKLAGKRRQGQEGTQEYDAREAARRASGGSDHAQRKRRRMEASTGGSVQASRFVEGQTADEEEEAAEETDWHSFEFRG